MESNEWQLVPLQCISLFYTYNERSGVDVSVFHIITIVERCNGLFSITKSKDSQSKYSRKNFFQLLIGHCDVVSLSNAATKFSVF